MPLRSLAAKRVLLTGASSGIGRALAGELARHGARLVLTARRAERLQEVAREVAAAGGTAEIVAGDITSPAVRGACLAAAERAFGGLDILLNNAGVGAIGPFAQASAERLRTLLEVNFVAPVELIRAALPLLQRGDDPLVVNMGSVLAHRAVPNKSEYCASKFALRGFSESVRAELTGQGVAVLLVNPSTTQSEFFASVLENAGGEGWKPGGSATPQYVARQTVRAMQGRRREVVLTLGGKLLVWCNRLAPWLLDWVLARRQSS